MASSGNRSLRLGVIVLAMLPIAALISSGLQPALAVPESAWVAVTDRSLEIVAGSPLDFSAITPLAGDGTLRIAGDQFTESGRPVTLNCASLAPGFSPTDRSGFPDHDAADRYALQLRRHGYNLVRFHYVDALLMQGAKADFAVDPVQLDRFHYFTAALSRNGIHWLMDVMSSPNAALGNVFPNRWSTNHGMNWRVFVEPNAFAHWQRWATFLLTSHNPYSGRALVSDPGTAGLILDNEPSLIYRSLVAGGGWGSPFLPGLAKEFSAWQRRQFPGENALDPPATLKTSGPGMARFQAFLTYVQRDTTRRMTDTVRTTGYAGPVTSFDNWPMINQIPLRLGLDFIDMHGYAQNESLSNDGRFSAPSSLADGGRYLQIIGATRVFGKPMTVSEHGNFFPNPRRYESGLLVPAFAAIQGWNAVCQHADGPIMLTYDGKGVRKNAIYTDSVGLDPVRRVGETLTALLLLRHEIAAAPGAIGITPDEGTALRAKPMDMIGPQIGMLGWLVRLGIGPTPAGSEGVNVPLASLLTGPLGISRGNSKNDMIGALEARGAISAAAAQAARGNVWRSPDGTVTLDLGAPRLNVVTRLTAAVAGDAVTQPIDLGPVRLIRSDAPGLVAVSALDGRELRNSGRMLVMMVSDARNSGMKIDESVPRIVAQGTLPVTLRRMQAILRFSAPDNSRWRLSPLHMDGSEMAPRNLSGGANGLTFKLDTRSPAGGAVCFFVLRRLDAAVSATTLH